MKRGRLRRYRRCRVSLFNPLTVRARGRARKLAQCATLAVVFARRSCFDQDGPSERSSLLDPGSTAAAEEKKGNVINAAFYGVQVFYSFFIM